MRAAIICILTLLFLPAGARAEDMQITLKDLEVEALKNNPEIQMAEKRAESAGERKTLAAAAPDPEIGYAIKNVGGLSTSTVGKEEMSMQGWVFTQEIPFPGKLGAKGNAARKQSEREHENAREMKLRVLNNLRAAYYEYHFLFRSSEILEQTKELMKNFQHIAETRYSTGQGMQQDVLRSQLEVSMILDKLAELEQKKEAQAGLINSLVGRSPLASLGRPADLARTSTGRSMDDMAAMALAHSPALHGKQRMVEQSEFELSMSRREYLPDFVVSAGRFTRGDFKDFYEASVMLKVPLYFWNKSAGVRAASADLSASRYDLEAARLMTLTRVRELYSMMRTSEHHIHLYESGIIPQARLALQSTTSNYQVGKTDFTALLESQNLLLKYRLMEQEELVNLNKTMSMLGEITGEEHAN